MIDLVYSIGNQTPKMNRNGSILVIVLSILNLLSPGWTVPQNIQQPQVEYFQFMRSTYGQNLSVVAEEYGLNDFEQNFTEFQKNFDKRYSDSDDLQVRRANFLYSLKLVKENENEFKTGRVPYRLKINKFADFGIQEKIFVNHKALKARHEAANKPLPFIKNTTGFDMRKFKESSITFPPEFSWRNQSLVTPVEDQGTCGSSWIFAGVTTVETANAIAGNPLVVLSKQQVLDCAIQPFYLSDGCNGGILDDVYQYAKQVGIALAKAYPYTAKQGVCENMLKEWREWIHRYTYLPLNSSDEVIMWVIYNKGPVAALINAGDRQFELYSGGVLTDGGDRNLDTEYNHYVAIVGWGNDNGLDYWLVKNSWGTDWGEDGYVRMIRNVNNRGINTAVAYVEALPVHQEPRKKDKDKDHHNKPEPDSANPIHHISIGLFSSMISFVILFVFLLD